MKVTILPGEANRFAAMLIDQVNNVFVYLSTEDHFNEFHGFCIGDSHTLNKLAFFADAAEQTSQFVGHHRGQRQY